MEEKRETKDLWEYKFLKEFEEKAIRYLQKSRERREEVYRFLDMLTEKFACVFEELFGVDEDPERNVLFLTLTSSGPDVYFRYIKTEGEPEGFYLSINDRGVNGIPVKELKGEKLWYAVRKITRGLPKLYDLFERTEIDQEIQYSRFFNFLVMQGLI